MKTTSRFKRSKNSPLSLAVIEQSEPITEQRLAHMKPLCVPNMRLKPHDSPLPPLVLTEQFPRLAAVFPRRPFVNFTRRLNHSRLANSMWQTLSYEAHCASSHVPRKQLKLRLVGLLSLNGAFAKKRFACEQLDFIATVRNVFHNVDFVACTHWQIIIFCFFR